MAKVSVMLPSYNHESWIGESIESVLNQSFSNLELVIVDDGSQDKSAEIIKKYAKEDSRIKFEIFKSNKGAVNALKRCMELSSGEYLSITSSDDIWYPQKLEVQVPYLENNPQLGAIFSLATHVNQYAKPVHLSNDVFLKSLIPKTSSEWMKFFFREGNCLCHHSILVRKTCYEQVGFYNPTYRILPDMDMWVRLFHKFDILVLNQELIKFRRHSYNESGRYVGNRARSAMEYKQILNLFPNLISTVKELKNIFPESNIPVKDDKLTTFYWAMLAMKENTKYHQAFAFDTLYNELGKPDIYSIINENGLYSHRRLSEDVVSCDVFNSMQKKIMKLPFGLEVKRLL